MMMTSSSDVRSDRGMYVSAVVVEDEREEGERVCASAEDACGDVAAEGVAAMELKDVAAAGVLSNVDEGGLIKADNAVAGAVACGASVGVHASLPSKETSRRCAVSRVHSTA